MALIAVPCRYDAAARLLDASALAWLVGPAGEVLPITADEFVVMNAAQLEGFELFLSFTSAAIAVARARGRS